MNWMRVVTVIHQFVKLSDAYSKLMFESTFYHFRKIKYQTKIYLVGLCQILMILRKRIPNFDDCFKQLHCSGKETMTHEEKNID